MHDDARTRWLNTKQGLKRTFGLWAIRREDITAARNSWHMFRRATGTEGSNPFVQLAAFAAVIAAYGRVFSGNMGLGGKDLNEWVPPEDGELHEQLMKLRHEAVAHSDLAFRSIRLIPPGAVVRGVPVVPAHETDRWRWFVRAGELKADVDHVERRLLWLQKGFEARVFEAFDRLIAHCGKEIVVSTETSLADF